MKLTLCLLLAVVAVLPTLALATTQPLLLCPIGQRATPVYDSNGKVIAWVCTKR